MNVMFDGWLRGISLRYWKWTKQNARKDFACMCVYYMSLEKVLKNTFQVINMVIKERKVKEVRAREISVH